MKTMALRTLIQECSKGRTEGLHTDAELELVEMERENASLREQLRLANDKMAEQVRQARWEIANDAMVRMPPFSVQSREHVEFFEWLESVRDANTSKD